MGGPELLPVPIRSNPADVDGVTAEQVQDLALEAPGRVAWGNRPSMRCHDAWPQMSQVGTKPYDCGLHVKAGEAHKSQGAAG